ncbi:S-layer homology domain-containing protein [Brevibacillus dissolubilis]|uniref:S-layer homology domain-containing protein n=1 Tax=Brevibacillus dissolubilis TaxID=1844116 RepID=UPI00159BDECC|nr:S-layer homology domain-containing protein [Brevibacillus dissolubilis]
MKKINTKVIQAAIGFTVLQPFLFADVSTVLADEAKLKAAEDKSVYLSTHYNSGLDNLGTHYIGFAYQGDGSDGTMTAYLKFDLSSLGAGAKIQSAILKLPLQEMDNTSKPPIINVWESTDDSWTESGSTAAGKGDSVRLNETVTDISTPKQYDVTEFVKEQMTAGDMKASFVLEGWTTATYGAYNPGDYVYSFVGFTDRTGAGYPELLITYSSNSAPTQINLSNSTVAENNTVGQVVGTLSAVDPDADETATFSVISGDTDAFEISGNQLVTKKAFDFETKASYSVGVRVTDKANNTMDKTFTINVTDVNEAPTGTITINSSAATTQSSTVTLNLTASDPEGHSLQMQFSNDNVTWSGWEAYNPTKTWNLSAGDGPKTVYMKLRDSNNLESPVYSDAILLDATAPNGSITINSGAVATNSSNVTLQVTGTDANGPVQMRFANESGSWSSWEPVVASKAWTLSAGDGVKTINMELRDATGNVRALNDTITLDTTAPIVTGVTNGQVTNQDVTISFNEGTAVLNGSVFVDGTVVTAENNYTLVVTDAAGNTRTVTFTIDKTPPTATLGINSGASTTKTDSVNLSLTGMQGGAVLMRFSNDGTVWSGWESFGTSKTWTLQSGADGVRTVTVELQDAAGNIGQTSDTIIMDTIAPAGSVTINGGASHTNSATVSLDLAGTDANGTVQMRFSNEGGTWSGWENFAPTKTWTLSALDGNKTVNMELRDGAGNTQLYSDTIQLDTVSPVVTGVTNGQVTNSNVSISFDEGTATLDGLPYVEGTTVSAEGAHTLVVTDAAGNSTTITFTIDKTNPSGTLTIAGGSLITKDVNINLEISDTQDAVQMQFSNDNATWSGWEAVGPAKAWTISAPDGDKTIYMKLKDAAGNEAVVTTTIKLDTTAPTGSININGGSTHTASENVTLDVSGTDENGSVEMRFANESGSWSAWEPVQSAKSWTLSNGDGSKTVNMELRDQAGNVATYNKTITLDKTKPVVTGVTNAQVSKTDLTITFNEGTATLNGNPFNSGDVVSAEGAHNLVVTDAAGNTTSISFFIDKTLPTGSLSVNSGATHTTSTNVTLNVTATDDQGGVGMRFSNNGTDWSAWEPFQSTKNWTIDAVEGTRTVYMELSDGAGNINAYTDSIVLDTTKPVVTGVTNGQVTNSNLTISFNEGTATLDGNPFNSGDQVTAEGTHTLIVTDEAGNVTTITFTIDKTIPTATFSIMAGADFTNSTSVNLTVANPQGATDMQFSTDQVTWSTWESVKASTAWTLSAGDGTKTVYMKLRDAAGNYIIYSDTIILDTVAPTGSISINSGAAKTGQKDVTLTLTGSDDNGQVEMRFMNDGGSWSAWEPFSATKAWSIREEEGNRTVTVEMRDQAGNTASFTDTIELDNTKPIVTGVSEGQLTNSDLTITFNEGTATLNGNPFNSGEQVTAEGSYELVVTDAVNNSTTIHFRIDKTKPTGGFTINSGASHSQTNNVTLDVTAADNNGAVQMRFSNNGVDWDAWETAASTKNWSLTGGEGLKTVYMELRDPAGNIESFTRTITVDTIKPIVTGVTDGQSSSTDLTISFNEGTATLNGQPFVSGTTISVEGDYTLVVTDPAGNKTTVTFTLDKTQPTSELGIANGAPFTASSSVMLSVTDVKSGEQMRFANEDMVWSAWMPAASLQAWNLSNGDGVKTVYMEVRDPAGNIHSSSDTIIVDTTKPTGSVIINSGATVTNQTGVTLDITAQDLNGPVQVRFSNGDGTWSAWESAAATKSWTLDSTDGLKTVTMEVRDAAGNIETFTNTIELDTKGPIVTGVTDGQVTNSDLTISFNEGTATLNGQPFVSGTAVTDEGNYTLIVTDAAGNVTTISFTLDKNAPSGTMNINNGATATNKTAVRLNMSGTENSGQMRFSNDGSTWSAWEAVNTTKDWTLEDGDGTKTVYVQLRDQAGNISSGSDTIELDTTAPIVSGVTDGQVTNSDLTITFNEGTALLNGQPFTSGATVSAEDSYTLVVTDEAGNETTIRFTLDKDAPNGTFQINNGAAVTNKTDVILKLDGVQGSAEMRISNDGTTWTAWQAVTSTTPWTLENGDGEKTVYLEIRDQAGNIASISDTILLDTTPPSVMGVINGETYDEPVTVTFSDGYATLNGETFTNGGTVSQDGEYTLVVTDEAGNTTYVRFTIKQDAVVITGTISINNNAPVTTSRDVVLTLSADSGDRADDLYMRFSNDNDNWIDWVPYSSTYEWTLDPSFGLKTVYMQLKDKEDHISATASDTIRYESEDTTDPDDYIVFGQEDETLTLSVTDFVYEGDLAKIKITSLPDHGELQLDGEEVEAGQEIDADDINGLAFEPDRNWYGETGFGWAGSGDGEEYSRPARILIRLEPVNDAPVAKSIRLTTRAGKPVDGTFQASDVEDDKITYRIVEQPESGRLEFDARTGEFRFYPQSGNYEEVTFTYQAFDGVTASEEATVTIVNRKSSNKPDDKDDNRNNGSNGNSNNSDEKQDNPIVDVGGAEDKQVVFAGARLTDDKETLAIDFDDKRMTQWIDKDPSRRMSITSLVTVPTIKLTFEAKSIQNLQQKNKGIDLIAHEGVYQLPLEQLDLSAIRSQLGDQVSLDGITITVTVNQTTDDSLEKIKATLGHSQAVTVVSGKGYHIQAVSGSQSVGINRFDQYVQSRVELPASSGSISTAVMLLPDGTVQPVPTKIVQENGKQVAIINSMTNGELAFVSNTKSFTDMNWHWAATEVNALASRLIVNGVDANRFAPDRRINRAEFTAILARGLGLWSAGGQGGFADVSSQDWFSRPVDTVAGYGVVSGYGDSNFRPNQEISRQEAMVLIARAMKLVGMQNTMPQEEIDRVLASYSDSQQISSWARESVALCVTSGIAVGNHNKLMPEGSITRAQMATMIMRLLQKAQYV